MQWKRHGFYWVSGRPLFRALALSKILTHPRDRAEALEHMAYELARQGRPDLADEAARRAVACFAACAPDGLIANLLVDPLTAREAQIHETDPRRFAEALPNGWSRKHALGLLDQLSRPPALGRAVEYGLLPPQTPLAEPPEAALHPDRELEWDFMPTTALDLLQHTNAAIGAGDLAAAERILVIALASIDEADSTNKCDSGEMFPVAGIVLARLALRAADAQPLAPVSVQFTRCVAGWIDFAVMADGIRAEASASHLFDPFPAMVDWLAGLAAGRDGTWVIDEEGQHCELAVVKTPDGHRLRAGRIRNYRYTPILDAPVDPQQCARAFVAGLRALVTGGAYHPETWEARTLAQALADAFPGFGEKDLCALSAADLALLFDSVGHGRTRGEDVSAFLDWARSNLTPPWEVMGVFPFRNSEGEEIPKEWDGWGTEQRLAALQSFLRLQISNWNGSRLPDLLDDARLAGL